MILKLKKTNSSSQCDDIIRLGDVTPPSVMTCLRMMLVCPIRFTLVSPNVSLVGVFKNTLTFALYVGGKGGKRKGGTESESQMRGGGKEERSSKERKFKKERRRGIRRRGRKELGVEKRRGGKANESVKRR